MNKSIDDYRRKRDFDETPEPRPGDARVRGERPVFVVHRHDATRLHYDLRLEMEGVLRSWAVPKGFSFDPQDKHLAIRTEDHPLEYEHFHGVIPKGQYGAGTMTLWDRGTYDVVLAPDAPTAVRNGELKVILRGRRLRGEWHLVRTKQGPGTWLLFKSRDRYAGPPRDAALGIDLATAPRAPLPREIVAMEPGVQRADAFDDPAWIFEMAFEGQRVVVIKDGDDIVWSSPVSLPSVDAELRVLRADRAVLDGTLVVPDERQRPSVALLSEALREGRPESVRLYVSDLLYFDEFDLRSLPIVDRKAGLRLVVPPSDRVLFVDHVAGQGSRLAEAMRDAGLSSMLAKRMDAPHEGGPSDAWCRIELSHAESNAPSATPSTASRTSSRVKLTNLQKVYWPGTGQTKGDLLAYYRAVADTLLPYLRDRPLHLRRFPDGILGKSFYQKNIEDHLPAWIPTEVVASNRREKSTPYVVCNEVDALMFLINLGSIDVHPWMSRRGSLDSPDYAVIDLDPKEAPFLHVVQIARRVGEVLRDVGIDALLKTSGATGLHVHIPLVPGYTYEQARMFCEGVARLVATELPHIATVERVIGQREGKVYVDFGQNRRGQTIVPPYVCRPVRGATVSAPLLWDELTDDLTPAAFTLLTMPARLTQCGDLFAPLLANGCDLLPAADKLARRLRDDSSATS